MIRIKRALLLTLCSLFLVTAALFAASCGGGGKVGYTVDVYLQEGAAYTRSAEHSFTAEGEEGETVTVTPPAIGGYTFYGEHPDTVLTVTLDSAAEKNVFSLYYLKDGADYVEYNANPPQNAPVTGSVGVTVAENGVAKAAENGFQIAGYRFAGWSTRADGNVEYRAGEEIEVDGKLTLYAVWDRGRTDRFGGTDYLYTPAAEEGVVYLERGGVEFQGVLEGDLFTFKNDSGDVVLQGKIFGTQFNYRRDSIAGVYYAYNTYMTKPGEEGIDPLNRNETLTVDAYGDAEHRYRDENGRTVTETGSIYYHAQTDEYLFTDSETGEGFVYALGVLPGENPDPSYTEDDIAVFSSTFGEGGQYYQFITPDGVTGNLGASIIVLDGYGGMLWDYDWLVGYYYIENVYNNGFGMYMYRITAHVIDESGIFLEGGETDLHFYTLPLMDGSYAYVEAKAERGVYTDGQGGTLTLDGFGILSDSAVYEDAEGNTLVGSYTVSVSPRVSGTYIELTEIDNLTGPTGETATFLIGGTGFQKIDRIGENGGTEYIWLHNSTLDYAPLLVLSDEDYISDGHTLGKKAQFWLYPDAQSATLELAAEGYVTEEALKGGNVVMLTWHKTSERSGYEGRISETVMLLTGQTVDSNYLTRDVYVVFSDNGEPTYKVIEEQDGGAQLWYQNVGTNTLGSILIDGDGNYYAGGFTVDTNYSYFSAMGYFIYFDKDGAAQFIWMDVVMDNATGLPASFELLPPGTEDELPMLEMRADGTMNMDATMFRRGNDEGLYAADGNFDSPARQHGTFEYAGETEIGDEIWDFVTDNGVHLFSLVNYEFNYVEMGMVTRVLLYHRYNGTINGVYTAADGGTLDLDGYRGGVYTDAAGTQYKGEYTLSSDGRAVYFNAWSGDEYLFEVGSDRQLLLLDGVYGDYTYTTAGADVVLRFDGKGSVTAYLHASPIGDAGFYQIIDKELMEVNAFVDVGGGYPVSLVFCLVNGRCVTRTEEDRQYYISDDWAILSTDGYGGATYYYADGTGFITGYITVIDREDGFIRFRESVMSTDTYFMIDKENGVLSLPAYASVPYIYLSESLKVVAYGTDGLAQVDNSTGCYNIVDGKAKIYIQNGTTGRFEKVVYPAPTGSEIYVTDEGTFYLHSIARQNITLTGKIAMNGEGGFADVENVTIRFTLDSSSLDMLPATFQAEGKTYQLAITNHYIHPETGRITIGIALCNPEEYAYYPIEVHYIPAVAGAVPVSSFVAQGGLNTVTLTDYNEEGRSVITETYVGFGPVVLQAKRASGTLDCGDKGTLTFANAEVVQIARIEDVLYTTIRYLVKFVQNGVQYGVIYEKEVDGYYSLYQIVYYDEVETGGYLVGVGRYYYSNAAYVFTAGYKTGDFSNVQLFKKDGETLTHIPAFNSLTNPRDNTAWMIREDEGTTDRERYNTGYFFNVTFDGASGKATAAEVKEYDFYQGLTDASAADPAFVNFFVDKETKEIKLVAFMAYDAESNIVFMNIESVVKQSDYVFTVTDTDGNEYTVTIVTDPADGKPMEDSYGQWLIQVA